MWPRRWVHQWHPVLHVAAQSPGHRWWPADLGLWPGGPHSAWLHPELHGRHIPVSGGPAGVHPGPRGAPLVWITFSLWTRTDEHHSVNYAWRWFVLMLLSSIYNTIFCNVHWFVNFLFFPPHYGLWTKLSLPHNVCLAWCIIQRLLVEVVKLNNFNKRYFFFQPSLTDTISNIYKVQDPVFMNTFNI